MPSDYSALESLLLFQYLYSYGSILPTAFTRLSDQLKSDPNIRAAPKYDASRFTPDALRDFFLSILNDEAKRSSSSTSDPDATNGSSAQNSKKRKAPTPPLPSLQDATNNLHLVPQLILRLYSQFRQQTVEEIREDERLYEKYRQEVLEIERGEWDERLQKGLEEQEKRRFPGLRSNGDQRASISPQPPKKPERPSPIHLEPTQPSNHSIQRTPSPTSTTIELPKTVPRHPPPQVVIQQAPPLHIQSSQSPISSQSPYRTGTPSQPQTYSKTASADRPTSPLVPAPAAKLPTIGPAKMQQAPTRTPSQPQAFPPKYPPAPYGQPSISPTGTPGPPKPGQQQPYGSVPYPSQRGGVMLQPFQVSPQAPTPFSQQPQLPTAQQQTSTPIQSRIAPPLRGGASTSVPLATKPTAQQSPLVMSIVQRLSNPNLRSTPPSTPLPSTLRRSIGTAWKNPERIPYGARSPERPRSISPIDDRQSATEHIATVRKRGQKQNQLTASDRPSTRAGRASSRKIRGASTASSVMGSSARGRTRSQSIASHTSADDSGSKTVKHEPPSTPMDTSEMMADDTPMPAPPRRGPSKRNKRKRSVAASEASAPDLGRGFTADVDNLPESEGPTTVLAVRNFPRLSSSKFNEINSHKHASVFSKPVRDRDAAGYSSMIRRPTDLKTIKAQIQAGPLAINADETAAASTSPAILLPWSEDLVPPKAIVNSAQLERELMRMFANAVMFNPGVEDVVSDAREMFEDAIVELAQFREAERSAEEAAAVREESKAIVEDEDEGTPTTAIAASKRRRVG